MTRRPRAGDGAVGVASGSTRRRGRRGRATDRSWSSPTRRRPISPPWSTSWRRTPPRRRPRRRPGGSRSRCASTAPTSTRWPPRPRCRAAALVGALLEARLTVAFLGFLPGFAYLEGLPPPWPPWRAGRRRGAVGARREPGAGRRLRRHLPAGLAGRVAASGAHRLRALRPRGRALRRPRSRRHRRAARPSTTRAPVTARARASLAVRRGVHRGGGGPGPVVDGPGPRPHRRGRGWACPRAGAADPYSLRAANRLVGNEDGAGALEVTARGPVLRFAGPAHVAVVGRAELRRRRPGRASRHRGPRRTGPGALGGCRARRPALLPRRVGRVRSSPPVLGSRSSDVLTGLGPGAAAGRGRPRRRPARTAPGPARAPRRADRRPTRPVLRVIPGPDHLATDAAERLAAGTWEVGPASDRMGVRLHGDGGSEADGHCPGAPASPRGGW